MAVGLLGLLGRTGLAATKATGKGILGVGSAAASVAGSALMSSAERVQSVTSRAASIPRTTVSRGARYLAREAGVSPILDVISSSLPSRRSRDDSPRESSFSGGGVDIKLNALISATRRVADNTDKISDTVTAMNIQLKELVTKIGSIPVASPAATAGTVTQAGPSGVGGIAKAMGAAGIGALAALLGSKALAGTGDKSGGDKTEIPEWIKDPKKSMKGFFDFISDPINALVASILGPAAVKGGAAIARKIPTNLGLRPAAPPIEPVIPKQAPKPLPVVPKQAPKPPPVVPKVSVPTPPKTPPVQFRIRDLPANIQKQYMDAAKAAGKNINLGSFVSNELLESVKKSQTGLGRAASTVASAASKVGRFTFGLGKAITSPDVLVTGGASIQEARARKYLSEEELTGLKKEFESGMEAARFRRGEELDRIEQEGGVAGGQTRRRLGNELAAEQAKLRQDYYNKIMDLIAKRGGNESKDLLDRIGSFLEGKISVKGLINSDKSLKNNVPKPGATAETAASNRTSVPLPVFAQGGAPTIINNYTQPSGSGAVSSGATQGAGVSSPISTQKGPSMLQWTLYGSKSFVPANN